MLISKPRHVALYFSKWSNPADIYKVINKLNRLEVDNVQQTKGMDEQTLNQVLLGMRAVLNDPKNFMSEPITIELPFNGVLMHYIHADGKVTYRSGADNILAFLTALETE